MKWNIRHLGTFLTIALGNALYALGVTLFIYPGDLITGGTTGIALFLNAAFGVKVSLFVLIFNVAMFLLGLAVLGVKFAATTAISTFFYPAALAMMEQLVGELVLTADPMLCTIFAGICIGLSLGLVIRCGASTGGMDIPPLVMHKLWKTPVSAVMYGFDVVILLLQIPFHSGERILYGIILIMIYTVILDKCLMVGTSKTEIKVVSKHSEDIRQLILHKIDRGVTMLDGTTGYLQRETELVLSVISTRELSRTCKLIQEVDPNAFLIISKVTEVQGRGFSGPKQYR